MITRVIFFDVETNGLNSRCSVLSMAALKCLYNGSDIDTIEDRFFRYYFRQPGEAPDRGALAVNGLTDDVIARKREGAVYPEYFKDDMNNYKSFCSGVNHYVGHNIRFDRQFLSFPLKHSFCTMIENTGIINLMRRGRKKWPRLSETARFYQITVSDAALHDSAYDIMLTYEIFKKMLSHEKAWKKTTAFLERSVD
jgi:DNA polymerase-3 subunit epsilon